MTHAIIHTFYLLAMLTGAIIPICVAFTIIVCGIYGLKEGK